MNNHINNKYVATGISSYNDSFWKAMRGSDKAYGDLIDGKHSLTNTYLLPESTATKYNAALKEYDLFRRIGTVMNATKSDSKIWLSDNDDFPAWVSEHGTIPTTVESFPKKDVAAYKLAIITAIETDFISDLGFDLERYLVVQFAKRFGKAEEAAFINGTGVNMPRGILHDTEGAEIGVEAAGDISFDDVLALYFSVFKEYLGHTVNFKTHKKSFKIKKKINNDPSEWAVFENTHEAIIEQGVFDAVKRIRDGRRRVDRLGAMPMLSGMLFCADCGAKLYQVRGKGWPHEKEYFVCATYRKVKGGCSSHQIRNVVIEQLLLDDLQRVTNYARNHEVEFIQLVTKSSEKALEKEIRDSRREYDEAKARITKLDTLIQRIYEDNVEGKISDERFAKMSATYEAEQAQLTERAAELEKLLSDARQKAINADYFLSLVRKYTDIQELDAQIIREFVEKILVFKTEKVNGRRVQRIRIIYNCIGAIDIPEKDEKTA